MEMPTEKEMIRHPLRCADRGAAEWLTVIATTFFAHGLFVGIKFSDPSPGFGRIVALFAPGWRLVPSIPWHPYPVLPEGQPKDPFFTSTPIPVTIFPGKSVQPYSQRTIEYDEMHGSFRKFQSIYFN